MTSSIIPRFPQPIRAQASNFEPKGDLHKTQHKMQFKRVAISCESPRVKGSNEKVERAKVLAEIKLSLYSALELHTKAFENNKQLNLSANAGSPDLILFRADFTSAPVSARADEPGMLSSDKGKQAFRHKMELFTSNYDTGYDPGYDSADDSDDDDYDVAKEQKKMQKEIIKESHKQNNVNDVNKEDETTFL